MKRTELVHVAVAETSVIVRSGLVAVLKRMPDLIICLLYTSDAADEL